MFLSIEWFYFFYIEFDTFRST